MTLIADTDTNGEQLVSSRGRRIVFTPERFDQIRNLVERGHGREEIAEIIGCTLGSLQVTCSKHGVSLRRQRIDGAPPIKRTPPPIVPPQPSDLTRDPNDVLSPPGGWPPGHPWSGEPKPSATFSLRVNYGKRKYDLPLKIDDHTLCELACVADLNGMSLSEILARAIVAGIREITS
jgi:hypothetical protein